MINMDSWGHYFNYLNYLAVKIYPSLFFRHLFTQQLREDFRLAVFLVFARFHPVGRYWRSVPVSGGTVDSCGWFQHARLEDILLWHRLVRLLALKVHSLHLLVEKRVILFLVPVAHLLCHLRKLPFLILLQRIKMLLHLCRLSIWSNLLLLLLDHSVNHLFLSHLLLLNPSEEHRVSLLLKLGSLQHFVVLERDFDLKVI